MSDNQKPISVLFVCLGNICRSPMAESIFHHRVNERGMADKFVVDSAGIGDWHIGNRPDRRTISELASRGIAFQSLARQIRREDFEAFDHIVAMDHQNVQLLRQLQGARPEKVSLALDWDPIAPSQEVPDPYYGGPEDFRNVYELLSPAIDAMLAKLAPTDDRR